MKKLILSIALMLFVMQAKAQIPEFLRFEKEVYIFESDVFLEVKLTSFQMKDDTTISIKGTFQKKV